MSVSFVNAKDAIFDRLAYCQIHGNCHTNAPRRPRKNTTPPVFKRSDRGTQSDTPKCEEQLRQCEEEKKQASQEQKRLRRLLDDLQKDVAEMDALKVSLEESGKRIQRLRKISLRLIARDYKARESEDTLSQQLDQTHRRLTATSGDLKRKEKDLAGTQKVLQAETKKVLGLEEYVEDLQSFQDKLIDKIKALEKELEDEQSVRSRIEETSNATSGELDRKERDLAETQRNLQEETTKVQNLSKNVKDLQKNLEQLREKIDTLEATLGSKEQELAAERNEVSRLKNVNEQIAADRDALSASIQETEQKNKDLLKKINQLEETTRSIYLRFEGDQAKERKQQPLELSNHQQASNSDSSQKVGGSRLPTYIWQTMNAFLNIYNDVTDSEDSEGSDIYSHRLGPPETQQQQEAAATETSASNSDEQQQKQPTASSFRFPGLRPWNSEQLEETARTINIRFEQDRAKEQPLEKETAGSYLESTVAAEH